MNNHLWAYLHSDDVARTKRIHRNGIFRAPRTREEVEDRIWFAETLLRTLIGSSTAEQLVGEEKFNAIQQAKKYLENINEKQS